jgi:glutaredoxin
MKTRRVRLFIKRYCPWCHEASAWLQRHGIAHEVLDVHADERAYDEMVRLSGQTRAPVIEVDGKVLADFGAAEIARWWPKEIGPLATGREEESARP